jgi:proteasome lid subunit RPN8/RPN11
VPSQTDVNLASWWPGIDWIICSLEGGEAVVRGFAIEGPAVTEIELVVH